MALSPRFLLRSSAASSHHVIGLTCTAVTRKKCRWQDRRLHSATNFRTMKARAAPSDVFVLDFDGVIVDSEPEVSSSAYGAACSYWPDIFASVTPEQQAAIMDGLRKSRPVLVQGYESVVMARLLLEDPASWRAILSGWHQLLPATLQRWGESTASLIPVFEQHRNSKMNGGGASEWLALNRAYPNVREALQYCQSPFYIASSKAGHRVANLLENNLGLKLPADSPRLFCTLLPPNEKKVEALRTIMARPVCEDPGTTLHFVDDRFETLQAVMEAGEDLRRYKLYLADWGYCTEEEKEEARRREGVSVLSLKQFLELLKWGLVMGVDDGCEPTPEEVRAGV